MKSKESNILRKRFQPFLGACHVQILAACCIGILSTNAPAFAQQAVAGCGSLANAYGPFDYRTEKDNKLKVVEAYHFTPIVEALIKGSTGSVGQDLDYTLRASPNHHRALMAMQRLGEKLATPQPHGAQYSVDCYFRRALQFRPDDNTARLIYASFLVKHNRESEANEHLEYAIANTDNAFTHYNAGLIYFDLKNYDKALKQAHAAMAMGLPRTELRDQLQSVGKWSEPVAGVATSPNNAASKPEDAASK